MLELVILKFHRFRTCVQSDTMQKRTWDSRKRYPDDVGEKVSNRERLCWQFSPSASQWFSKRSPYNHSAASAEDACVMGRKASSILTL